MLPLIVLHTFKSKSLWSVLYLNAFTVNNCFITFFIKKYHSVYTLQFQNFLVISVIFLRQISTEIVKFYVIHWLLHPVLAVLIKPSNYGDSQTGYRGFYLRFTKNSLRKSTPWRVIEHHFIHFDIRSSLVHKERNFVKL